MEEKGRGRERLRLGWVVQQRGLGKGSKSGQRAERRQTGKEGGRGRGRGRSETMEKCGDIAQQSGWCEGGRVRNVAGNAGASSVCKKKTHTATFLILDITDKLSKHTQCAFNVQGCNIQIFDTASHLRLYSFCVFSPSVNKADVGDIKYNRCRNS